MDISQWEIAWEEPWLYKERFASKTRAHFKAKQNVMGFVCYGFFLVTFEALQLRNDDDDDDDLCLLLLTTYLHGLTSTYDTTLWVILENSVQGKGSNISMCATSNVSIGLMPS